MNKKLGLDNIRIMQFKDININDDFFISIKKDCEVFEKWFTKNSEIKCYVQVDDDNAIKALLSFEIENNCDQDYTPKLTEKNYLKISAFKIDASGKRMCENFIDLAIRYALDKKIQHIYLNVSNKEEQLIKMLSQFGFVNYAKNNITSETIFIKELIYQEKELSLYRNFPFANVSKSKFFILGILPIYHSKMFPWSKLKNVQNEYTETPFTNGITKIYLAGMKGASEIKHGDLLFIYKTSGGKKAKLYSVISSACVVEEFRHLSSFKSYEEFAKYCQIYSVFSEEELIEFYKTKKYPYVIKMLYINNLPKKISRQTLFENQIIDPLKYSGFVPLSKTKVKQILKLGECNDNNLIID